MRIDSVLMTADAVGGVWTYALDLCSGLSARGIRVALATMGRPLSPEQRVQARAIPRLELMESTYRLEWMEDPWDDVERAGAWLLELEQRLRPEIVHLNGYTHAALPWTRRPLVVGHSCMLSWWEAVYGAPAPERFQRYQQNVSRGIQRAGSVVAPTRAMLDSLQKHYGAVGRGSVIFNARAAHLFFPRTKRPLVLGAGRLWDEGKNVSALETAASRLKWPLVVAGEVERPGERAVHLKHVLALGHLPPTLLAQWMGSAAIYAHPARYEPFGLCVLEAALCGCALVLGDLPSLREVWGDCAVYCHPHKAEELAERIQALIDDEEELARLSNAARARALTFGLDRMVDAYLSTYAELFESAP